MLVKYSGNIGNGSWDSAQCEYVLPAELRPPVEVNGMVCVSNGQTARMLVVNPNGTIRCANMGAAGSNQGCTGDVSGEDRTDAMPTDSTDSASSQEA